MSCGWMYETRHTDGSEGRESNYTVWSEVFIMPGMRQGDVIFLDAEAIDDGESATSVTSFPCPQCSATLNKSQG